MSHDPTDTTHRKPRRIFGTTYEKYIIRGSLGLTAILVGVLYYVFKLPFVVSRVTNHLNIPPTEEDQLFTLGQNNFYLQYVSRELRRRLKERKQREKELKDKDVINA